MAWTASKGNLMPELDTRAQLALLGRALWREGYNDHLAGHITINAGDGTLWCNPWLLRWEELRPRDVIRIDLAGNLLEGEWPIPPGIPLHLELHRARPDVGVAMHNHPLFGVVWSDIGEIPPILDQSSALGGGELVLVDEYTGAVNASNSARDAIAKMGDADMALLAGHGVFVLGSTVRAVYQRAVALEQRCQRAWHARAVARQPLASPLPPQVQEGFRNSDGNRFVGFWEAAVRAELRAAPDLLDSGPH